MIIWFVVILNVCCVLDFPVPFHDQERPFPRTGPLPKTCRRAHLQMVPAWGTEHEAQLERHASSTAVPAQRESEPHVQYRRAYESELVMHVRN